ncbi:aspartic peptidase domain-containing protein [Podospora fimiseda]|uniref:Aspartic peptidase domain-containing protein n=1 Tax=Podospora fimiseda TaxID=252190 RepID=A0AAN7BKI8_9PEZI|nr:aspartic peptidase domain-containing protein [Podospora fimiseda]
MASTRLSAIALYLLAAATTTTNVVNAHVLVPFSQNTEHHAEESRHQLSARAENSVGTKLTSNIYSWLVKAAVGTPPQEVSLIINPSVGHTWVPDGSRSTCRGYQTTRDCEQYRRWPEYYTYDPSDWADNSPTCIDGKVNTTGTCKWGSYLSKDSSTYLPPNSRTPTFRQETVDGFVISGSNFTDKLKVGDIELDDYPMGIAYSSRQPLGVLGLGRNGSVEGYTGFYVNFIDRLVRESKIKSPAYSIWLDNPEGTSGNLLFGAVDKAKYEGDLLRLDADTSTSSYWQTFNVDVHSINGTKGSGEAMAPIRSNDFPLTAAISPGEVYSYLPEIITDNIASMVGASYNKDLYLMTIPCDAATKNPASFKFRLNSEGGPVINVETADLVLPLEMELSKSSSSASDLPDNTCIFGIQKWYSSSSSSSSSSSYTSSSYYSNIGSALLKRTYMVFDVANREIAIAPVKFSASSSDVVPFSKWGAYIPSSRAFDSSITCAEDEYIYYGTCYGKDGSRSSGGNGRNSYGYPSMDGTEHWRQVALGVGVTFGVLLLIAVIAATVVCVRRAKSKKAQGKEADVEGGESSGDEITASARAVPGAPSADQTLPLVQEGRETSPTVPQLPALAVTPPPAQEPRPNSDAVSAVSDEPAQAEQATVKDPKEKGKEVDTSS